MRQINWLKAARKAFDAFPEAVQAEMADALGVAAKGEMSDDAKPFKGIGGGVFEIAVRHRGDAFRVIYAVRIAEAVWVVDAFQKKSKSGIKTPHMDVERIRERIKRLREIYHD